MVSTPGSGGSPASPPSGVRNNVGTDGAAGARGRTLVDASGVVARSGVLLVITVADPADAAEPDPGATADAPEPDPVTADEDAACWPAPTEVSDPVLGAAQPASTIARVTAASAAHGVGPTRQLIGAAPRPDAAMGQSGPGSPHSEYRRWTPRARYTT